MLQCYANIIMNNLTYSVSLFEWLYSYVVDAIYSLWSKHNKFYIDKNLCVQNVFILDYMAVICFVHYDTFYRLDSSK